VTPSLNPGGAVVFALGSALFLVLAAACAYESFALATGSITITTVTRGTITHHHLIAGAITAGLLVLLGHFWR
jgi:6,7-dimethyl-8-ribityllumazine synthase